MVDLGQNHVYTKSLWNTVLLGLCMPSVCPSDILKTYSSMTTYFPLYPVDLMAYYKPAPMLKLCRFKACLSNVQQISIFYY